MSKVALKASASVNDESGYGRNQFNTPQLHFQSRHFPMLNIGSANYAISDHPDINRDSILVQPAC